jgi:ferrochelatase
MAYGTPGAPNDVEAFYTDVRRGRPPSPEQLADLQRRYDAVGGVSQLTARTGEQLRGIQSALDASGRGRFECRYGAKHAEPKIETAVEALAATGLGRLVGLVLAPHYSSASVGEYIARAREAAAGHGMESRFIEDWHDNPVLISLLAARVRESLAEVGNCKKRLLVSAHSLPLRVIEGGDGYDLRLAETASLVAGEVPFADYQVCWQSAGRTPEPWIGPDVLEVLRGLPAEGYEGVVVCGAGFVSDHLEVNYDLDIEARALAQSLGLRFSRTESLNADARLCGELARLVEEAASGW